MQTSVMNPEANAGWLNYFSTINFVIKVNLVIKC